MIGDVLMQVVNYDKNGEEINIKDIIISYPLVYSILKKYLEKSINS